MKKRLTHISPLQCGTVLAALYFGLSLLVVPFFLLAMVAAAHAPQSASQSGNPFAALGIGFVIVIPIMYALIGFIGGIIAALIYNLIAKMTGGLEFTTVDVGSVMPPAIPYPAN